MVEGISVKEQIKKLVGLQNIDEKIYDIKHELEEKPAVIEQLKQDFEHSKSTLNALEEQHKNLLVTRKELELQLKTKEEGIAKANADLSAIKTNKEYTAKMHEIEGVKADKSQIEDKILGSYDEAEDLQKKIAEEKEKVAAREKVYLEKKKEIESQVQQLEAQTKELEAERNKLTPDIDKNTLSLYERILANKGGRAIVPIENNACGGCYMNVTHQAINLVKMGEQMVFCEVCARILYLKEDL